MEKMFSTIEDPYPYLKEDPEKSPQELESPESEKKKESELRKKQVSLIFCLKKYMEQNHEKFEEEDYDEEEDINTVKKNNF
jgi:hypothetical protein